MSWFFNSFTRCRGAFAPTTGCVNTEEFCEILRKFTLSKVLAKNKIRGSFAKHTYFHTFSQFPQPMRLHDSMVCSGPAFSAAAEPKFSISLQSIRDIILSIVVYVIHVWLLQKYNDCKNVKLLRTWGVFARLMWNCECAPIMWIVM